MTETLGTCQIVPKWYQKGQTLALFTKGTCGYIKSLTILYKLNFHRILKEKDVFMHSGPLITRVPCNSYIFFFKNLYIQI